MQGVIDIGEYLPDTIVFIGRESGEKVHRLARLNEIDELGSFVAWIHIPQETIAVSSSFFISMFAPSARRLGEHEFRRRYRFIGFDIAPTVNDGIAESLRQSQATNRSEKSETDYLLRYSWIPHRLLGIFR